LKVAAISMRPKKWNKEANATKLERLFRDAASRGVQVALATEGAIEGYVAEIAILKPELRDRMIDVAEKRDGEYIRRFSKLAKELNMCLCFGYAERAGSEVFNSAVFIDHSGSVRGEYRKMQFAEGYRDSWSFNRLGSQVRSFDTPHGRAGIVICYDRWNPILTRALVLDGAQMLYIPAYGSVKRRQDKAVLSRARENGVPIVEANVGLNLIISKGEIVVREKGVDKVTVAEIDVPVAPSQGEARKLEQEFLAGREKEMNVAYKNWIAEVSARVTRAKSLRKPSVAI
jgi:N-carbamoylputrescine amidase